MDRQDRRLRKETKLIAQLQGAVDIASRHLADYTTVVSREVTAVNLLRRERDGAKTSETRLQQELAAARGVLKKKVIVYDIFSIRKEVIRITLTTLRGPCNKARLISISLRMRSSWLPPERRRLRTTSSLVSRPSRWRLAVSWLVQKLGKSCECRPTTAAWTGWSAAGSSAHCQHPPAWPGD